jgi:hypothetical protein
MIRRMERTGRPRRVFTTCDWCGGDICEGEEYYNIHGEVLCFACVQDCLKRAEEE